MRGVVAEIGRLNPDDMTVLDMEASIEHLSRGTLREVDLLIVVAEPYYRALETVGRMVPLARELGIPEVIGVANKVRSPEDEVAVRSYCEGIGLEVVAVIPFDEAVQRADRERRGLLDVDEKSPALDAIAQVAAALDARARSVPPVTPG